MNMPRRLNPDWIIKVKEVSGNKIEPSRMAFDKVIVRLEGLEIQHKYHADPKEFVLNVLREQVAYCDARIKINEGRKETLNSDIESVLSYSFELKQENNNA